MKKYIILILLSLFPLLSFGYTFEGFLSTNSDSDMYIKYQKAKPGKETFVFINGLVYEIERWEKTSKELVRKGYGVLHYEFEGQHRTFKRSMDQNEGRPEWLYRGLNLNYLTEQLNDVLERLNLNNVNLVALSYGSSIASHFTSIYESKVNRLVLMSPLVIPLENYHPQGRQFHTWLDSLELWGPIGSFWSNYYYDLVYKWYYKQQRSSRNYDFGKWEKDYYRSVFHQVKAVRKFDLRKQLKKLKNTRVYFLTAEKEDKTYLPDQETSWLKIPQGIRGSLIRIKGAYHAIPDTKPKFTANYLLNLVAGLEILDSSRSFFGNLEDGKIHLKPLMAE